MIDGFFYTMKQDVGFLFEYASKINPSSAIEERAETVCMRVIAELGIVLSSAYAVRTIMKATSQSQVFSLLACTALFMLCHDLFLMITARLKNKDQTDNKEGGKIDFHAPKDPDDLSTKGVFYRPLWKQFEYLGNVVN